MKILKLLKSILKGAASLTIWPDPLPSEYPFYKTDAEALASDWRAIGLDLDIAIAKFEDEESIKSHEPI